MWDRYLFLPYRNDIMLIQSKQKSSNYLHSQNFQNNYTKWTSNVINTVRKNGVTVLHHSNWVAIVYLLYQLLEWPEWVQRFPRPQSANEILWWLLMINDDFEVGLIYFLFLGNFIPKFPIDSRCRYFHGNLMETEMIALNINRDMA